MPRPWNLLRNSIIYFRIYLFLWIYLLRVTVSTLKRSQARNISYNRNISSIFSISDEPFPTSGFIISDSLLWVQLAHTILSQHILVILSYLLFAPHDLNMNMGCLIRTHYRENGHSSVCTEAYLGNGPCANRNNEPSRSRFGYFLQTLVTLISHATSTICTKCSKILHEGLKRE